MTYEKAIEIMKQPARYSMQEREEAHEMAIDSMMMRISRKPSHSGLTYNCPHCLDTVGVIASTGKLIKNHHCRCGQKIDWNGVE